MAETAQYARIAQGWTNYSTAMREDVSRRCVPVIRKLAPRSILWIAIARVDARTYRSQLNIHVAKVLRARFARPTLGFYSQVFFSSGTKETHFDGHSFELQLYSWLPMTEWSSFCNWTREIYTWKNRIEQEFLYC